MSDPRVRMYTTTVCPFCVMAKRLLDRDGIAFEEINLSHEPERREALVRETGWRTVPMIFVDDELVGGYEDLAMLRSRGGLGSLKEG